MSKKIPQKWWDQFPKKLQVVSQARLWASIGAGGVLYLSPLVFNGLGLSPTEIGIGITCAALAGTISRFITGIFLDKGINCSTPIKIAALLVVLADINLLLSQDFNSYVQGQILLGTSAGIYWPSVEMTIPISCEDRFSTSKAFALARSADALGISIGALIGTIASSLGAIRLIYVIDIICMLILLKLLRYEKLSQVIEKSEVKKSTIQRFLKFKSTLNTNNVWVNKLIRLLILSLFCTGMLSLLQSGLPLDLVKGGINRPELQETLSGLIIAIQLILLLIFQWPIGNWLSHKNLEFSLKLSIICLGLGCLTLSISSIFTNGLYLALLSLIPIAIGLTAFLPTATEAIIKIVPLSNRGIAMAMYSQVFGISALISPLISGIIIESYGSGYLLWLIMFIISIPAFLLIKRMN